MRKAGQWVGVVFAAVVLFAANTTVVWMAVSEEVAR